MGLKGAPLSQVLITLEYFPLGHNLQSVGPSFMFTESEFVHVDHFPTAHHAQLDFFLECVNHPLGQAWQHLPALFDMLEQTRLLRPE